ncbi:MAG: hypothetical protein JRE61_15415 [Deltaproteobacteria bacterium]|nr:hypothetical protein [Deltaproteobacteria bacterium]
MVEILKKIFESNPENSTILLNDTCSDCKRKVVIEITPTSGGFGLQGGALYKNTLESYSAKCPDCFKVTPKTVN